MMFRSACFRYVPLQCECSERAERTAAAARRVSCARARAEWSLAGVARRAIRQSESEPESGRAASCGRARQMAAAEGRESLVAVAVGH